MVPGRSYWPEDVLRILWEKKWWIFTPFVLLTGGAVSLSLSLPDRYRSETLILSVPIGVAQGYVRSTVNLPIGTRLRAIGEQILSRANLEPIIRDLGLYSEQRDRLTMEQLVALMRKDVEVSTAGGETFRLGFSYSGPVEAMEVTTRLSSLFTGGEFFDRVEIAQGTLAFLAGELDRARQELIAQEKRREEYQRRYAGELPSQLPSNLQTVQNLQLQLQALRESINRDRDRRLVAQRAIADLTAPGVAALVAPLGAGPAGDPLALAGLSTAERLDRATRELASLELRLKPEHPDVVGLKREIEVLMREAEQEAAATTVANGGAAALATRPPAVIARENRLTERRAELEDLDRRLGGREAQEQELEASIQEYQARIEAVPTRESELVELNRDYGTLQQMYVGLLLKKEEAEIAADLERRQVGRQFDIVDPAPLPEEPFSPNRPLITIAGAVLGLGLGLALVGLFEYRDLTLRTDDEVLAALSLPVLAVIPVMETTADVRRRKRRRLGLAVAGLAVGVVLAALAVVWKLNLWPVS